MFENSTPQKRFESANCPTSNDVITRSWIEFFCPSITQYNSYVIIIPTIKTSQHLIRSSNKTHQTNDEKKERKRRDKWKRGRSSVKSKQKVSLILLVHPILSYFENILEWMCTCSQKWDYKFFRHTSSWVHKRVHKRQLKPNVGKISWKCVQPLYSVWYQKLLLNFKEKTGSNKHSTSHIHLDVRQACDIRIVMVRL